MPTLAEKIAFAKQMRENPTETEAAMWAWLSSPRMSFTWVRQEIVWGWIVDFYCPEQRIILEVDGLSHNTPTAQARDAIRDQVMEAKGLIVVRVLAPVIEYVPTEFWTDLIWVPLLSKYIARDVNHGTTPVLTIGLALHLEQKLRDGSLTLGDVQQARLVLV